MIYDLHGKDVTGVSKRIIEGAIEVAVTTAHKTLERLSRFGAGDIRGDAGEDGKIAEYQVVLKVAFRLKGK